jgi:hypothetical protein
VRLSQVKADEWDQMAPYVDTVLLPVYRIRFPEKRLDVAEAKRINRVAALVEEELKGRLLLTSPIPYTTEHTDVWEHYLCEVVRDLAAAPFPHVVILAPREWDWTGRSLDSNVLITRVGAEEETETASKQVVSQIISWWQGGLGYDATNGRK